MQERMLPIKSLVLLYSLLFHLRTLLRDMHKRVNESTCWIKETWEKTNKRQWMIRSGLPCVSPKPWSVGPRLVCAQPSYKLQASFPRGTGTLDLIFLASSRQVAHHLLPPSYMLHAFARGVVVLGPCPPCNCATMVKLPLVFLSFFFFHGGRQSDWLSLL